MKAHNEEKKNNTVTGRLTLAGGGAGLALFAIYGIMNATLAGGLVGLRLAGTITGFPVEPGIVSRVIVALGMLSGVVVAGAIAIAAGAAIGWLVGKAVDSIGSAMQYNKPHASAKN